MPQKTVVIAGYPKSGNTWITRLVAELIQCPVVGFWKAPNSYPEIACEGEDRISDFQCYKSHHPFKSFRNERSDDEFYLIHVVRDPRDIAISGANFFRLEKDLLLLIKALLHPVSPGGKAYRTLMVGIEALPVDPSVYLHKGEARINKMIEILLQGDTTVNPWLVPWKRYVKPYLTNNVFSVRYEDVLINPDQACSRILDYLQIKRTDHEVKLAIKAQSFKTTKQRFIHANDIQRSDFLKTGRAEQWRTAMNPKQIAQFAEIQEILTQLRYPLE